MNHLDRSHKENPKQNESKLRRPYDVSSRVFGQLLLPQPQALQHTCLYYALKLSTPGEELGFSFGLWRILADLGRSGIDNYKGTRSQLLPLILDLFAAVHRTTRCSCANLVAKSGF